MAKMARAEESTNLALGSVLSISSTIPVDFVTIIYTIGEKK